MLKRKIAFILAIPTVIIGLYFGLIFGYINPMIKGLDVKIIGGTFITNINRYVIKVGDVVNLSTGDYIVVPSFAKKPKLNFAVLDDKGVLTVKNNKLIANKEGYSSIGILNKNRVLRKAVIMVVNPKIKNMEISLSKPIKYFGDEAEIISTVDIEDFKKLERGYKLKYSTTKPDILKIEGDKIEAIGIGEARLISRYERNEIQKIIKILPRVDRIKIGDYFELEEEEKIILKPEIVTNPSNQKMAVKYKPLNNVDQSKFDDNIIIINGKNGPERSQGIVIDKKGSMLAKREGTYKVKITAGNKSTTTVVNVKPQSFSNKKVRNLNYFISNKDNKFDVEIGWDYLENVNTYRVYVQYEDGEEPVLFTTVKASGNNFSSKDRRLSNILSFDILNKKNFKYKIFVVGYNGYEETKKSNEIIVSNTQNLDFQKKKVKGIAYKVDKVNGNTLIKWKPIHNNKCTYRVYYKDRTRKKNSYNLISNNVNKERMIVKIDAKEIDYEFYVLAIDESGQVSSFSNPVRIKAKFLE